MDTKLKEGIPPPWKGVKMSKHNLSLKQTDPFAEYADLDEAPKKSNAAKIAVAALAVFVAFLILYFSIWVPAQLSKSQDKSSPKQSVPR